MRCAQPLITIVLIPMCTDVFPLKLQWLLRIPFFNADKSVPELMKRMQNPLLSPTDPISLIRRAIPKKLPLTVTEILPRLKEGGAFVKFSHEPHLGAEEIEGTLREYLKNNPIKPWFNPFRQVRTFLVRGRPWVEDLYRFPSSRLRVEFIPTAPGGEAAELSQEILYSLFRRYGKLADILPQPADSKVLPKFAYLNFIRVRQAIMAKNCMHGFTVLEGAGGGKAGTVLKLGYEQKTKPHWWRYATNFVVERELLNMFQGLVSQSSEDSDTCCGCPSRYLYRCGI